MSVITVEDIENSPGITLADIVAKQTSVEASATAYLGDSHTLTFGVDYQNSELSNPENLDDNLAETYQGAIFSQEKGRYS